MRDFILGGSKITAYGECSHEISLGLPKQIAPEMPFETLAGKKTMSLERCAKLC